jgi:hypothetical protein
LREEKVTFIVIFPLQNRSHTEAQARDTGLRSFQLVRDGATLQADRSKLTTCLRIYSFNVTNCFTATQNDCCPLVLKSAASDELGSASAYRGVGGPLFVAQAIKRESRGMAPQGRALMGRI